MSEVRFVREQTPDGTFVREIPYEVTDAVLAKEADDAFLRSAILSLEAGMPPTQDQLRRILAILTKAEMDRR